MYMDPHSLFCLFGCCFLFCFVFSASMDSDVCVLVCLRVWMWNVDHSKEEDWNIFFGFVFITSWTIAI